MPNMMQDIIIARQPVFDKQFKLCSYEILFRHQDNLYRSDDHMTAQVLVSALLDIGFEQLSGGQKIHINASASLLLSDLEILHTLPTEYVGIEILETVPITDAIITACKRLKDKGFTILLDDVVYAPHLKPLIDLADIIKVDLPRIQDLTEEVRTLRQYPVKLLAEKVETHEQYKQVTALNFDYVQGYFYQKPEIIHGRKISDSKLNILKALQKVMTAEAVSDIHEVIKQDVTLAYRLMKYINSASFGLKQHIESIEQALALLGLDNIRRWLSLLALATLGERKTPELIKAGLIRAYVLEHIAKQCGENNTGDDFLLGMFSILDALLDMDMEQALADLYLPYGVREGLLDANTAMGKKMQMCLALEHGDWAVVQQWISKHKAVEITCITRIYLEAIAWADAQMQNISA